MKIRHVILASVLLMNSISSLAADKNIGVSDSATYYDERIIAANIKNECKELGSQFSASTKKYLEKNGWSVNLNSNVDSSTEGAKLKLLITNAVSGGNAFLGHRKSVSIEAALYDGDKLVDTYVGTRNSGGGFGAGFKGSCAVLARCVNTLGNDVAKWLKKKNI